jgi:hypothetical protein
MSIVQHNLARDEDGKACRLCWSGVDVPCRCVAHCGSDFCTGARNE